MTAMVGGCARLEIDVGLRIIVSGYVVRYPLAGNVWAHLQYVIGLARLGNDVWFVEEAGWPESCYDPEQNRMTSDPAYGVRVLTGLLARHGLAEKWAYRDTFGEWHGLPGAQVDEVIAGADLFLDVGGTGYLPQMRYAKRRAYIDMDPAFTQFRAFGAHARLHEYDVLFTYGGNIGRPRCRVPTLGFAWTALRPPVVLDIWRTSALPPPGAPWTTIANWVAYGSCEYEGETYGQKDVEFMRLGDLPARVAYPIEVAVAGDDIPSDVLETNGWRLRDSLAVSRDPWDYRDYLHASRGEFSVAKHGYVTTRCGWFSDRTATYLASGRPAVVQDTGIGEDLPVGNGLLLFRTADEAAAALDTIEADYEAHVRAARVIAERHFDSDKVLAGLLAACIV